MQWTAAVLATFTTIALGCGGQVITPSQSSNATSGNGGAASSAAASGAGGMGGSGGSLVASTSTGAEPAACNDATVFVDILGDGPNQHFDASCAPEGHINYPGGAKSPPPPGPPPPGSTLVINACPTAPGLVLILGGQSSTWPASIANATVLYFHDGAEYDASPAESGALEVFTFEPVGGVIEGAFTATVAAKDPAGIPSKIQITGKFRICRGPDLVPV